MKEWANRIKYWTMMYYILSEKDSAYGILPTPTTIMEYPIGALWSGAT